MRTIRFTKSEMEFLRAKYREEVFLAEEYISQIRDMLRKLDDAEEFAVREPALQPRKRGRKPKPKPVSEEPLVPKKRGRPPLSRREPEVSVPAYSIDLSSPKKKKSKKRSRNYKSSGGMLNLAPLAKQKNIKDLVLEKLPEMISRIQDPKKQNPES